MQTLARFGQFWGKKGEQIVGVALRIEDVKQYRVNCGLRWAFLGLNVLECFFADCDKVHQLCYDFVPLFRKAHATVHHEVDLKEERVIDRSFFFTKYSGFFIHQIALVWSFSLQMHTLLVTEESNTSKHSPKVQIDFINIDWDPILFYNRLQWHFFLAALIEVTERKKSLKTEKLDIWKET